MLLYFMWVHIFYSYFFYKCFSYYIDPAFIFFLTCIHFYFYNTKQRYIYVYICSILLCAYIYIVYYTLPRCQFPPLSDNYWVKVEYWCSSVVSRAGKRVPILLVGMSRHIDVYIYIYINAWHIYYIIFQCWIHWL